MAALPRSYSAPLDVVDGKLGELREMFDRLIQADERFRTREIELRREVLTIGEELQKAMKEVAERDQIIDELRAMLGQKNGSAVTT